MKRKRHTEDQIIAILKEHEAGVKTADLFRKHGISDATFYYLWTAPPVQEGFSSWLTSVDCKHLSGVTGRWCAQMGNPLTLASTTGRPRRPL